MIGPIVKRLFFIACLIAAPASAQQAAQPLPSSEDYQAAMAELAAQNAALSNRVLALVVDLARAKREAADLAAKLKTETPAAPAAPN